MSNPTSNFGWVMPTSSDLVTDLPADFDINQKLTAYLANKYNQRTLTGYRPQ